MARRSISERQEARNRERDELAQETAAGDAPQLPRRAPAYVRAKSPDGYDVVFTPGEALPVWVADRLGASPVITDGGVIELDGQGDADA